MVDVPSDLLALSQLFAPTQRPPKVNQPPKIKPLKERFPRTLTEDDLRRMYKLRHGSEDPADINKIVLRYDQIGKRLHIPHSTVHYALNRYER